MGVCNRDLFGKGAGAQAAVYFRSLCLSIVLFFPLNAFAQTYTDYDGIFNISWSVSNSYNGGIFSHVQVRQISGSPGAGTTVGGGSTTSGQTTNITRPNGTYVFNIEGCYTFNSPPVCHVDTTKTYIVSIVTAPPANPPATFTVPATDGDGTYTVSWSTVADAETYELQERINGGAWSTIHNTSGTGETFSGGTAKGNGSYGYQVKSCNSLGCSAYSATQTTDVAITPGVPSSISISPNPSAGNVTVTWGAASGSITAYDMDYQLGSGSWTNAYDGTNLTVNVSSLAVGSYTFQVRACRTTGSYTNCSGWSSGTASVVTPPAAPGGFTVPASDADGSYSVSWNTVSGATLYELQESTDGGTNWTTIQNTSSISKSFSGGSAKGNGSYSYHVRACNGTICGNYTATQTTDVAITPGIAAGLGLTLGSDGTSISSVSWSSTGGANGYRVQRRLNGGSWSEVYSGSALTTGSFTGLSAGAYEHQVRACRTSGAYTNCSAWSGSFTGHVPGTSGGVPVDSDLHTLANITSTTANTQYIDFDGSFILSWSDDNAQNYSYTVIQTTPGSATYATGTTSSTTFNNLADGLYTLTVEKCWTFSTQGGPVTQCIPHTTPLQIKVHKVVPNSPPASLTVPPTDGDGAYTVSWNAHSLAASYELQESTNGGTSWATIQNNSMTSKGFSGGTAKGNGSYGYRVRACNTVGCSAYTSVVTTHVAIAPGVPSSINVSPNPSTGNVTVTWGSSTGSITEYDLDYQLDSGSWTNAYNGALLTTPLSGLAVGSYNIQVRACKTTGSYTNCSGWRAGTFTIMLPPPMPTGLITPGSNGDGGFTVSWNTASGATSYELQEQIDGGSFGTIQNTSATSKGFSGGTAKGNGSYGYRVRACNVVGCSAYTSVVTTHVAIAPGVPSSINVSPNPSTGNVTVTWGAASGSVTAYDLDYQLGSGSWTNAYNGALLTTPLSGLAVGSYNIQVRACKTTGSYTNCSGWRTGTFTIMLPPPMPTGLTTPGGDGDGGFSVSWNTASTATGYELQESTNGGSNWSTIQNTNATSLIFSGGTAKGNGSYSYRVRACNAVGCSSYTATQTTDVAIAPGAPASLNSALGVDGTSISSATWTAASGSVTNYQLEQRLNGGSWSPVYSGSALTAGPFTGLSAGEYGHQVRACKTVGSYTNCSAWTGSIIAYVPGLNSGTPNDADAYVLSAYSILYIDLDGYFNLDWMSVPGAEYYKVIQSTPGSQTYQESSTFRSFSNQPDGLYTFTVTSCTTNGNEVCTPIAAPLQILVQKIAPNGPPATLTVPATDPDGSFTVSWATHPLAGTYELQESANGGTNWTTIQNTSATSRNISGKGNGSYSYQVRACNSAGCGSYATMQTTDVAIAPGVPVSINISPNPSTGNVTVTWGTASGSVTLYDLEYQLGSGIWNNGYEGPNLSANLSSLASGSYTFQVRACRTTGSYTNCSGWRSGTATVNRLPTISDIGNQTINEDGNTGSISFTVDDPETAAGSLTVTATSGNTTLVPNANLTLGGSGANRTLIVTPAANQNGPSVTITVIVSDGISSASDTFVLTVNAVNDAPTISDIGNLMVNEDTNPGALNFTIADLETTAGSLTVTASSSNTTLVPNNSANLTPGGSGANRTLTVKPAANQSGTATITVTVSDGVLSGGDTFVLTVNAVNDQPTISNIDNQTIYEDANTGSLDFTVGDVETEADSLTVTATSSNPTLVPINSANLALGGSGASRNITVTPAANQTGTAMITVTVSDGSLSRSDHFMLTVNANDAPTISNITDQTISEDGNTGSLGFTVGDSETAAGSLTVTATSSHQGLVPNANLALTNSGASRTITVTPAPNMHGTAIITVTVTDGSTPVSDTFELTVNGVNDAPTISDIGNQTINEDVDTGALSFTVGDGESSPGSLVVTAWSSNSAVVPNHSSYLILGGSGASRTITVRPLANKSGSATITVTVSDGTLSASDSFTVTVNPVSDAPVISNIEDQTINQDGHTDSLAFTVRDAETAASSLTVTATSSNTVLVPNGNLSLTGSGGSRAIRVTPEANQFGTVTITVTVSDGTLSASVTFTVTVNDVPRSPADSDNDGNFIVTWNVNPGPEYGGYTILWQRFNGGSWTYVTDRELGSQSQPISVTQSGIYEYKVDYGYCTASQGGCPMTTGSTMLPAVAVLFAPGLPSIGSASADGCAGSLSVDWSAGSGYPAGATIYYDLQESVNSGEWKTRLVDTTLDSWLRSAASGGSYRYRVRSRYTLSGYYSHSTGWVSNTAYTVPGCTGGGEETIPQPPESPSDVIGSIEGSFNVAPLGAAVYSIPLEVPPGIGGMAPKVSLDYNSQGGYGFVGTGWSLGGFSAITRCAATLEPDGFVDGVDFESDDRFCLDGKKLILVPGTGGYGTADSAYRTENDGFSKIVAVGNSNGAPVSFIVRARTGEEMLYGNSNDSRIEIEGSSKVMTWALTTITDSTDNKMEFYYNEYASNSEYVPNRVEYAFSDGINGARVQFAYSSQSSPTMYVAGSEARNTRLLQTITTYAAGQPVKEYQLDYDNAPGSGRKRLENLTECSLVSGTVCLEPTVFTWEGSQTPTVIQNFGNLEPTHSVAWDGAGQWPIDVDGDGKQELVYLRKDTIEYWYIKKTGSTWTTELWATRGNGMFGSPNQVDKAHHHWPMDVNGDGLVDLVYRHIHDKKHYVIENKGDGTTSEYFWGERTYDAAYDGQSWPLDVNGDGRMDLVYNRDNTGSYFALISNGSSYYATEDYLGERGAHGVGLGGTHWVMDVNSDGRPDLTYIQAGGGDYWAVINKGTSTWTSDWLVTRQYDAAFEYRNWVLDANADGLMDFVYGRTNSLEYRVLLNKGDTTMDEQTFGTREEIPGWDGAGWVIDVNADGVDDFVYNKHETDFYYAMVSQPDGSREREFFGSKNFLVGWGGLHIPMDADGDGLTELLAIVHNAKNYKTIGIQSSFDLLKSVTDGLGNRTSIQYKALNDSTVYDRVEDPYDTYHPDAISGMYDSISVTIPLRVVSKVTVPDGIGGTRNTEYFYKNLKIHKKGRGSLGFDEVISTDTQTNIRVETGHYQDFPYTGLVHQSVRCLNTGGACAVNKILQKTVNHFGFQTTVNGSGPDAVFVYPELTTETMYALDNTTDTTSVLATIKTDNIDFDNYGNLLLVEVTTDSAVDAQFYKTKTVNVYANDTDNWRLGLLTSSVVTKYLDGGSLMDANSVRKTAFEYDDATHLLIKEIVEPDRPDPFKLVTVYERDSYGNITKATSCATDFSYCGLPGQAGPSSLPFRTVTTEYDSFGQFPQSVTNAEGESESYVYDRKFGNKLSLTGPNNLTTSWTYDVFGKVLKETRADDTRTVTTYKLCDGHCPQHALYYVMTQSTGSAPVTEYFDAQGRKLRTRSVGFDGRNIHVDTVYNSLGQPIHLSEPYFENESAYWAQSEYDLIGRVVTVTPPLSPAVSTDYDGLTVTMSRIANGEFRTESETKNIIGQTVSMLNPAGTELIYTYDSQGNLITTQTQGYANTLITVNYDVLGRKTQLIDPDTGTWSYQYNGYGELVSQTNALNQTVTMKYDKLGRMVERNEPEGQTEWDYGDSSTYTPTDRNIGKLVSVSSPDVTRTFSYDSDGRPDETATSIDIVPYDTSDEYVTGQTFDAAGRVSTVLYPEVNGSRFQVKNHYSALGYLTKVTSLNGGVVYWEAQELNARGQLELALLGNGASVANTYKPETGWLDGIMVDANDLIYHMTYEIDEVGNIESRTDIRQNLTETFEYDILDQLTYSNVTGGSGHTPKSYAYDALGNITSKTGVGSYTYGTCSAGPHAVCQAGSATYAYNANGSMVNKNGGTAEVQYTSFNMPYQFDDLGSHSVTFHYGPDRTRIFKSGAAGYTAYVGMSDTGNALYEHEVQETDVMEKHLHFIYAGGQALAVHTIQTGSNPQTKTEYLHRDHLGSVEAISNSSGAAVAYFSHDAWGKPRNANWTDATGTPGGAPGNLGFTGHEMIPEVGLIHMNGRVYDPSLGKFLSADPQVQFEKDVRSYNRYSYVSNNPLRYTDPTGYGLERLGRWLERQVLNILNVISWFYAPIRPYVMALNMISIVYYAGDAAQGVGGVLAMYLGSFAGEGAAASYGAEEFMGAIIRGGTAGAVSGGANSMMMGGDLRRGILQGMAMGAATAAIKWTATQSPAETVKIGFTPSGDPVWDALQAKAHEIYGSMCSVNKCSGGINYYGMDLDEISAVQSAINQLLTNEDLFDTSGSKILVEAVINGGKPVIIAMNSYSAVVPMDWEGAMTPGVGSAAVLFFNATDYASVKGTATNLDILMIESEIYLPPAAILGHEFYHVQQIVRGVFPTGIAPLPEFGTRSLHEIQAIKYMNSISKDYERTSHE